MLGKGLHYLDQWGGTDVFQVAPGKIHIATGVDKIRCLKQTKKGALRWYASCCKTPLALTLQNMSVPFIAINCVCIIELTDPTKRDQYIGPIRARVNGHFPADNKPDKTDLASTLKMILHLAPLMVMWWWNNEHKRSPWLTDEGSPLVEAVLVDPEWSEKN